MQLLLQEGKPYNGSLLSYWKRGVFMAGGMVQVLGIVPYFSCKHDWTERKKKRSARASITAFKGHLATINQLITTHFSTEYSEPQPTKENIPRKYPLEGSHTHEGHFILTVLAFSLLLGLQQDWERQGEEVAKEKISSVFVFLNLPAFGMTSLMFSISAT